MKHIITFLTILFVFANVSASNSTLTAERVYLSGKGSSDAVKWDFKCSKGRNCGEWAKIPVPSNWQQHGFGAYDYGLTPREERSDETAIYKTRFFAPEEWKSRHLRIVFEGSMTETSIKVNGKSLGVPHLGGYLPFHYLLNDALKGDLLKYGEENELEIFVAKKPNNLSLDEAERSADYWVFGGIYRPVYIEIQPSAFVSRVAVDARADGSFRMDVFPQAHYETQFKTDSKILFDEVVAQIQARDGKPIGKTMTEFISGGSGRIRFNTNIKRPALWSPEHPSLYNVKITLKKQGVAVAEKVETFGFRTFELKRNDGLYLNGKKIRIKGVNRNTFDPQHARAIDADRVWREAREIKAMNANLVRSHLPPTIEFMKACDELGLLVITELSNWHAPYIDTPIARNITFDLVTTYQNHPSVIMWANGNEGGFNLEIDELYHLYDLQDRPVIHPWSLFEGLDTFHYPKYSDVTRKLKESTVFLPTEFLHGLFDGGHGAGLDDFWTAIRQSPVGAGGALWCWADAAIERTDLGGKLDTHGNKSADGIVGPNGEKEASYFTVREIWSPIQIPVDELPEDFSGKLPIENRYYDTNLKDFEFKWRLVGFSDANSAETKIIVDAEGTIKGLKVEPGKFSTIKLPIKKLLEQSDALQLTAFTSNGEEVMHWSWPLDKKNISANSQLASITPINNDPFELKMANQVWKFSPQTGQLVGVHIEGKETGLSKGPVLYAGTLTAALAFEDSWRATTENQGDSYTIKSKNNTGSFFSWTLSTNGSVMLDYHFSEISDELAYGAVGFDLTEENVVGKRWLGKGPFRVWANRMKGPSFYLWENAYNDHITGVNWGEPEFKGIFDKVDWMQINLKSGFSLLISPETYSTLGVLRPKNVKGELNKNSFDGPVHAWWHYPEGGDLHFFHKLPGVGSKFTNAEELGPQGEPARIEGPITGKVVFQFQ